MNFNLENNKLNIKNGNNTLYFESINKNTVYAFELWCWRRLLRVPWNATQKN